MLLIKKMSSCIFSPLPWYTKLLNYGIVVIGVLGMIAGTYASIYTLKNDDVTFVPPCYINLTAADEIVDAS